MKGDQDPKLTAPGSTLYYATRKLAPEKRQAIYTLHQLWHQLWQVVESAQEIEVARIKLAWWRQEIEQAFAGKAQHPLTQALQNLLQTDALPHSLFYPVLDTLEHALTPTTFATQAELETHYQALAGQLHIATCLVLADAELDETSIQYAIQSAIATEIIRHLNELIPHLQHHRCYLPTEHLTLPQTLLTQVVTSPQHTLTKAQCKSLKAMVHQQLDRAMQYRQQALSQLTPEQKKTLEAHIRYLNLQHKQGQLLRKHATHLLDYQVMLTPLKRAWFSR